jgi:YqaJ-like viral recombinase domain
MPNNQASSWNRRSFIGGSDARIIMGADQAALVRLWREKRGEAAPEDLSGDLIVQLGTATEELNRTWYERNTRRHVTDVQRRVRHSAIPWMVATLDGTVEATGAVFESKFMLPWSFSEEAAAEKWALRAIRRNAPPDQCRAAAAAHRGHPHRRYELVEFLGGIRHALPQHSERLSRP